MIMNFLLTMVDCSPTSLATTILAGRDSFISQMYLLLKEEDKVNHRSASILDTLLSHSFNKKKSKVKKGRGVFALSQKKKGLKQI